ncbi:hypothetical protein EJB05_48891, partial [Eragrostis curvula]
MRFNVRSFHVPTFPSKKRKEKKKRSNSPAVSPPPLCSGRLRAATARRTLAAGERQGPACRESRKGSAPARGREVLNRKVGPVRERVRRSSRREHNNAGGAHY